MTAKFASLVPYAPVHVATLQFPSLEVAADPQPVPAPKSSWTVWVGPLVSLLILFAVVYQLRTINFAELRALVPSSVLFWIAFAAYYLAGPASEWVIFHRLWRLPVEGFGALLRKFVSNEILLGYLGEVYFYAWARRNAQITTAPFGAIKDVTILSALTGNAFTLVMVAIAAPLFGQLHLGIDSTAFIASTAFILLSSAAALIFGKRLFTLPRHEVRIVAAIHVVRILATTLLAALMWHLLLPAVAVSWWLLLGTMRQILSRLPFLPNKDLVFAGLASFLVGSDVEIVSAMTLMASLVLGAHLIVGSCLGLSELVRESQRA